jgi:hypothetical protein
MEMTLHYFGTPDVDQRAIIDVLRTTEEEGTLTYDIVRGGHFSNLSASPVSTNYPDQVTRTSKSVVCVVCHHTRRRAVARDRRVACRRCPSYHRTRVLLPLS